MANFYYSGKGLGQGLANLGQALFPDPTGKEAAQMGYLGAKRNMAEADARKTNREVGMMDAYTASLPDLVAQFQNDPRTAALVNTISQGGFGDPAKLAEGLNLGAATGMALDPNADQRTLASIVGAGSGDAGKTLYGVEMADATNRRSQDLELAGTRYTADRRYDADVYEVDNKPLMVNGVNGPVYTTQAEGTSRGMAAVPSETEARGRAFSALSPEQQGVAVGPTRSEAQGTLATSILGQNRDINTMTPAEQAVMGVAPAAAADRAAAGLTGSEGKGLRERMDTLNGLTYTTGRLRDLLSQTNIGAVGSLQQLVQGVVGQARGAQELLVRMGDPARADALSGMADIDPALFDPSIGQVDYLLNTLAYQNAKMNDPGGRVSDADFRVARQSLQDRLMADPAQIVSVLDEIDRRAQHDMQYLQQRLGGASGSPAPAPQYPNAPEVGSVEDGYRYIGGDPANPQSWEAAQ